jgi:hypothetical protein
MDLEGHCRVAIGLRLDGDGNALLVKQLNGCEGRKTPFS